MREECWRMAPAVPLLHLQQTLSRPNGLTFTQYHMRAQKLLFHQ